MKTQKPDSRRGIPAAGLLLSRPVIVEAARRYGRRRVVAAVRALTGEMRQRAASGAETLIDLERLDQEIVASAARGSQISLRRVVNATGVILHTNLGRAPLAAEAVRRAIEAASGYSNLEFDLELGERGKRDDHFERLFSALPGEPAALVVNNNAAAVFLALNTLAEGSEVIVSRGELVEIGGAFRIPDICAKSGAVLREAGTTNRTREADYEAAITERTRMLLRVHPSNFRMIGFTERPSLERLAALAHQRGLVLMEDLGSGCLNDLAPFGVLDEPVVGESLKAGADVVTFSGDKLLGGPQAGLILGRRELLCQIRKNPLYRALRAGKLTIAALAATLSLYAAENYAAIPAQRMIRTPKAAVAARAQRFATKLRRIPNLSVHLKDGESAAGGGSSPGRPIPTRLVAVTHTSRNVDDLTSALRGNDPPVIARIEDRAVVIDLRTVLNRAEENEILQAFERLNA